MENHNPYQQMHYNSTFGKFKKVPYTGGYDLIYMGQYIVRNAKYAICQSAKNKLLKNKNTIKKLISLTRAE